MKSIHYLHLGVALVLVFCISNCGAISCHHCNSFTDGECQDPFDPYIGSFNGSSLPPSTLINCNTLKDGHTHTYCRKTVQIATLRPDKETTRVIRSCGFLEDSRLALEQGDDPSALKCYRRVGTYGVEILYCACYEDGCNSANTFVAGAGSIFILSLLASNILNLFQ